MYVTVTTADTTGEPIESDADGFEGFMMLAGEQRAIGLSFWESREAAERHSVVEGVEDYEVAFARLGPGLLGAAG